MYYDPYYQCESIYIAGPECFYENGYPHWFAMAGRAEMMGFQVTMPSNNPLNLEHEDLRENAKEIFRNCAVCMAQSTAIICDLEFYRGPDVDGGSIFEAGMAYARGCRCYGFTRDLRPMRFKYQGGQLIDGVLYDRKGRLLPYQDLPFSPNVVGALKIVEGDFDTALEQFGLDLTEARKRAGAHQPAPAPAAPKPPTSHPRPRILLSGGARYDADAAEKYAAMRQLCAQYGFDAITPVDTAPLGSGDAYADAYHTFEQNVQNVRDCDIILADLNDFHGWEPDSDTAFECGMAYQLGKRMFGYMANTTRMIDRIPNRGAAHEFRDACGCNAENFNYPINLMFSGCMPILEGGFETVLAEVAKALKE